MRESTTSFTWMKRKRNLVWYLMKQRVTIRMKRVKVGTNSCKIYFIDKDLDAAPLSRPTKKHDEDSTTSSKRDESPILKKASVSLRSTLYFIIFIIAMH